MNAQGCQKIPKLRDVICDLPASSGPSLLTQSNKIDILSMACINISGLAMSSVQVRK